MVTPSWNNSCTESIGFNFATSIGIVVSIIIFTTADLFWFSDINNELEFSKSYYFKFILSMLTFFICKFPQGTRGFNLILFYFCSAYWIMWTAVSSLWLSNIELSKYIGFLLIFGGFGAFVVVDELLVKIGEGARKSSLNIAFLSLTLKIILWLYFILAIYFFIWGKWHWPLLPLSYFVG